MFYLMGLHINAFVFGLAHYSSNRDPKMSCPSMSLTQCEYKMISFSEPNNE